MDQPTGSQGRQFYRQLKEGMQVYDSNGQPVGTIDRVHFGSTTDGATPDLGLPSNEAGRVPGGDTGLGKIIEDVFEGASDLDEEMRQNLSRAGFIRVRGAGPNAESQYIQLDRVAGIRDNAAHLS